MPISDTLDYLATHDARFHAELYEFLRIPSVSAQPVHAPDVSLAANWLRDQFEQVGLEASIHPTEGHPVVLGEWRGAGPDARTILVYGHYDVQPAEPLDLWDSPPFEPTLRDGRIYARGSVDDKGQLFLHVKAIEAYLATHGKLPVNVIVLAEGEEEVGSEHLAPFIEAHAERLACDGVVISDSSMFAPGLPSILSSLRGLAYFQIDVEGPSGDLHSGSYGGAVVNPAMALARILSTFHDAQGHVTIPGFYDAVREWESSVRAQIRQLPFDNEAFRHETGAPALGGEAGYSTLERIWIRLDRPLCAQLLAHCVRNQRADLAAKLHLWAREQEVRFSDYMFETLLDLVAPLGDQAMLQAINSNMRSWGVAPTTAQMAAMVRGYLAAGDWRRAVQWFQDIPRLTGQLAAASLHAALIDGLLDSLPTPHDLALPRVETASASLSAMVHLPPSITTQRLLRRSREKVGLAWVSLGYPSREDALYINF